MVGKILGGARFTGMKKLGTSKRNLNNLAVTTETVRALTETQLAAVVGGALDPKPHPSLKISCSGSKYC